MRLHLDSPPGWTARRNGDHLTLEHGAFGTRIVARPLAPKPFDPRAAIEGGIPAGGRVEYGVVLEPTHTRDGWTMQLATLDVRDAAGARVETRIAAVYDASDHVGVAVAHVPAYALDRDRAIVVEVLTAARPLLWPDAIVCIAELWRMEPP